MDLPSVDIEAFLMFLCPCDLEFMNLIVFDSIDDFQSADLNYMHACEYIIVSI